jgi:hypothetical protein
MAEQMVFIVGTPFMYLRTALSAAEQMYKQKGNERVATFMVPLDIFEKAKIAGACAPEGSESA